MTSRCNQKRPVIVAAAALVCLGVAACAPAISRKVDAARAQGFEAMDAMSADIAAGRCDAAILRVETNTSMYVDRLFRSSVYERCGRHDAAVESLLEVSVASGYAPSNTDFYRVVRLLDAREIEPGKADDFLRQALGRQRCYSDAGKNPPCRSARVLQQMIIPRLFDEASVPDYRFIEWQLKNMPKRLIGTELRRLDERVAALSDPGSYESRHTHAETRRLQLPESEWLRQRLLEWNARVTVLERTLRDLKLAYFARQAPWLEACEYRLAEFANMGYTSDTDNTWICHHRTCLIPERQSPVTFAYGGPGSDKIQREIDEPNGSMTGYRAVTAFGTWRIETSNLRRQAEEFATGLNYRLPAMNASNCSGSYWRANFFGPESTYFREWIDTLPDSTRVFDWATDFGTATFSEIYAETEQARRQSSSSRHSNRRRTTHLVGQELETVWR